MYTNILHEKGLKSIAERFKSSYLDENVLELLELCLNINDFEFDGKCFLQNSRTTMGTKWSPHYADIYLAYFEDKNVKKNVHISHLFICGIWMIYLLFGIMEGPPSQDLSIFLIPTNHPADSGPPSMKIP